MDTRDSFTFSVGVGMLALLTMESQETAFLGRMDELCEKGAQTNEQTSGV